MDEKANQSPAQQQPSPGHRTPFLFSRKRFLIEGAIMLVIGIIVAGRAVLGFLSSNAPETSVSEFVSAWVGINFILAGLWIAFKSNIALWLLIASLAAIVVAQIVL